MPVTKDEIANILQYSGDNLGKNIALLKDGYNNAIDFNKALPLDFEPRALK